jgi:hypothetical protein
MNLKKPFLNAILALHSSKDLRKQEVLALQIEIRRS